MPKKRQDSRQKYRRPIPDERVPPPLNEELTAKLRAAVDAARRKRIPQHDPE